MMMSTPIFSDFSTAFLQNPLSGDLGMVVNENAVRASLKNLILTNRYERLLDPYIGTNLQALLFETPDSGVTKLIQEYIKTTIQNYEPRVNLIDVQCVAYPQQNGFMATIKYSIAQFSKVQTLSLPLTRVR